MAINIRLHSSGKQEEAKIHRAFKRLYSSKKRYYFITGGRGSLKSSSVQDFVVRLTFERGHGILFTRYTMRSAELSIIPAFRTTLRRLGLEEYFKITKTMVINKETGSFIYFSGIKTNDGDQTAYLKGIEGITTWIIDEGEDFRDENSFNTIEDSIREAGIQNRIIWIQNPTTMDHFIYEKWIVPSNKKKNIEGFNVTVSTVKEVVHIHTSYHIAEELGYLAQSWIDKAESYRLEAAKMKLEDPGSEYKSHYYYNYIGGWQEQAEGVVFDTWEEGEFNKNVIFGYGMDYGFSPDPLAMLKVGIDRKKKVLWLKEIDYSNEQTNLDILEMLVKNRINKKSLIVADTNEPRTTRFLKNKGYNITKAFKPSDGIKEDIREIKEYRMIVDPDSSNLKRELNLWRWDDKKASIPIGEHDHLMSALRYIFRRLTKGKKRGIKRNNALLY